jgi:hypothetical protein
MSAGIQHADVQRRTYEDVSVSGFVLAADDYSTNKRALVAAKAGETIYVQKVNIIVTTDNAATQTVQDTASTPLIAAKTTASPGVAKDFLFDWGAQGLALTEGKGLDLTNSAAGLAYSFTVEAYRRRTANITS